MKKSKIIQETEHIIVRDNGFLSNKTVEIKPKIIKSKYIRNYVNVDISGNMLCRNCQAHLKYEIGVANCPICEAELY